MATTPSYFVNVTCGSLSTWDKNIHQGGLANTRMPHCHGGVASECLLERHEGNLVCATSEDRHIKSGKVGQKLTGVVSVTLRDHN
jgi:hypothetical protein